MQLHGGKNPIVLYQEMKLQFELHVSIEQLPCNVTGPFADPFVDHFTIFVLIHLSSSVPHRSVIRPLPFNNSWKSENRVSKHGSKRGYAWNTPWRETN